MSVGQLLTEQVAPAVGTAVAFFLYLSPFPAVRRAWKSGSLGELNSLPFVLMVANTVVWLGYSYVTKDPYVYAANAPGFVFGMAYALTCFRFDTKEKADFNTLLLLMMALGFPLLGFISIEVVTDPDSQKYMWGITANIILLFFYSSPLSTAWHVIKTRNSASLQLPLCCMNIVCGSLWLVYGLAVQDYWIGVPNGVGAFLGVIQVMLCLAYRRKLERLPTDKRAICTAREENYSGDSSDSNSSPA